MTGMSLDDAGWEARLLESLKAGDEMAALQVWALYRTRLEALVRHRLGISRIRCLENEEDLALSTFHCLIAGAASGQFSEFRTLKDLWKLLAAIARRKSKSQKAHAQRLKRGGDGGQRDDPSPPGRLPAVENGSPMVPVDREASPSDQALLADLKEYFLEQLRDDTLRKVAELRLDGHSNREIAGQLGCSERTVERKLERIRWVWIERGLLFLSE
jgi:DNA-directed RNA polymerase specialized sigma24 family protein